MPDTRYVIRMTKCVCGHEAVAHYDSHMFCTYIIDGECDCEMFRPVGQEVLVDVKTTPDMSGGKEEK